MKRALPAIAISAAGVTWLLHAQGVIDASVTAADPATDTVTARRPPDTSIRPTSPSTPSTTSTTTRSGRGAPSPGAPSTSTPSTKPPTTAPTTTAPTGSGAGGKTAGTVTGPSVNTRFGPVQVAAVVSNGQVTDVKTLQAPDSHRRSQQINNRALPILRQEAVAAQSSNIDSVSGATITSDAYATSLQAALDEAGLRR